jgi:hypothetical protein
VIDPHVHQLVVHQLVVHQLVVLPRVHHPHEKSVQHEVAAQIVPVQVGKVLKVAKSAIHAGFAPHLKNATSLESVHESLSQIFLKMLLVKS